MRTLSDCRLQIQEQQEVWAGRDERFSTMQLFPSQVELSVGPDLSGPLVGRAVDCEAIDPR